MTYLVARSGNRLQDAIREDADARIAEAKAATVKLENANLQLRKDLDAESGKVAGLQKAAVDALAQQQRVQIELVEQQGRTATLETASSEAKKAQQRVETELAIQRERTAIAEKNLLELQERIKDRHLSSATREKFVALLKAGPTGSIDVSCIGGNPEPCTFAAELVDALKAGGWTLSSFNQGIIFVGSSPSGLRIQVHSNEKPPQRAINLQQALKAIGIEANGELSPGLAEDAVSLLVGSKP